MINSGFSGWCKSEGIVYLDDLDHRHIKQFLVSQSDRGLAAHTVHGNARAIRTFLNFCVRDGLIDESPFKRVKMPKMEHKVLPALSADEVRKLTKACSSTRELAIVLFLLDSGVRASELCAMNVRDVDMAAGTVLVIQGKGQKDRTTYVGAIFRKALRRYLAERGNPDETGPLFVSV